MDANQRWRIAGAAALLVVGVAGGWLLAGHGAATPAPEYAPDGNDAQPVSMPMAVVRPAGEAADPVSAALPPIDVPILEQLQQLGPRARAGDVDAACRLGTALRHCIHHERSGQPYTEESAAGSIARESNPELQQIRIEAHALMQESWRQAEEACQGISKAEHQRAALDHLLLAAVNGSTAARAEFLRTQLTITDLLQHPELGQLYMDHAPRLYRQMLSEGDPQAILLLQFVRARTIDERNALWHAVPEELRDRDLGQALLNLHIDRGVAYLLDVKPVDRRPLPTESEVEARRIWDAHFEHSPFIAALREHYARAHAGLIDPRPAPRLPDPCNDDR
jgi:hypothetical protein